MKVKSGIDLFVAAGCLALPAMAQSTADQSFTATVKIIAPISWSGATNLHFGTITAPTGASSDMTLVLKASDSSRTFTGGGDGTLINQNPAAQAAAATLHSESGYVVGITVGSYVPLDGGGTLMLSAATVNGGSLSDQAIGPGVTMTPVGITQAFTFGASVFIPKGTIAGTYSSGSFTITAAYN